MVEPGFALRGHMRSMSSLASTIMPYSPEIDRHCSAPLVPYSQYEDDLAEGLRIPLPPSSTCSENDQDIPELDRNLAYQKLDDAQIQKEQVKETENPICPPLDTSGEAKSTAPAGNTDRHDDRIVTGSHTTMPLPLEELVQAIRRELYEEDCLQSLRNQVHELMYTCTLFKHAVLVQSQLYRLMIDQYSLENKATFDLLYRKGLKVQRWPETTERSQPHVEGLIGKHGHDLVSEGRGNSWIDKLSPGSRQTVISLLREIRVDSNFLSSRLATLSNLQLSAIGRSGPPRPNTRDSVLHDQSYRRGTSTGDWKSQHRVSGSRVWGDPSGSPQDTPLSLLLNIVFDEGAELNRQERYRKFNTWSNACAQIVLDGKHGSDELIVLILDEIANSEPWPLALHLESYLMDLIQNGAFILDSTAVQHVDFTQHQESSNAQVAIGISEFFENALSAFIKLVNSEPSQAGMSNSMLDFICAVLYKVKDPKRRIEIRNFIISRWYFGSFLPAALIWPESRGLMMKHHISSAVRQRILKELASRMQRLVSDYLSPWKTKTLLESELAFGIGEFLKVFEPKSLEPENCKFLGPGVTNKQYLTLRSEDVLKIAESLFPDDEPLKTYPVPRDDSIPSVASSAGSSTLTSGTTERRLGTASSNAPSFGTSMTSNTIHSEVPPSALDDAHESIMSLTSVSGGYTTASKLDQEKFHCEVRNLVNDLRGVLVGQPTAGRDFDAPLSSQLAHFLIEQDERDLYPVSPSHISLGNPNAEVEQKLGSTFLESPTGRDRILVEALERLCQSGGPGFIHNHGPLTDLEEAFNQQIRFCQSGYDFQSTHFWWKSLKNLHDYSREDVRRFVVNMTEASRVKIQCFILLREEYSSWLMALRVRQKHLKGPLCELRNQCEKLRDKMWYLSDVRHSSIYEDTLNVARALRSMVGPVPSRQTGVAAWARSRLKSTIAPERTHAQTLEALTADHAHGGPFKMNDRQVERTSRWLTDQSIENFCKGEERIHRFLLEVQRCANKLVGESLLKSPVLWSSILYQYECRKYGIRSYQSMLGGSDDNGKRDIDYTATTPMTNHFSTMFSSTSLPYTSSGRVESSELRSNHDRNWGSASPLEFHLAGLPREPVRSYPLSGSSLEPWREFVTSPDFVPVPVPGHSSFNSPFIGVRPTTKQEFITQLKETTISLLLSDLGYSLWSSGSETDHRISHYRTTKQDSEKSREQTSSGKNPTITPESYAEAEAKPKTIEVDNHTRSATDSLELKKIESTLSEIIPQHTADKSYPYVEAYDKLLAKFGHSLDPFLKVNLLYELTLMVEHSLEDASDSPTRHRSSTSSDEHNTSDKQRMPEASNVGKPRTRATRLEEVMANCEDRRRSKMLPSQLTFDQSIYGQRRAPTVSNRTTKPRSVDTVPLLTKILSDSPLRTKTLFRDLQYVAALVPASYLDSTPQGRAFWDVGLAALHMKTNLCKSMIDRAHQIVAYHMHRQGYAKKFTFDNGGGPSERTTEDATLATTDLTSAAKLWAITALEGDPTAARELALAYLAHPESVPRITLPLSRPSEVFKLSLTSLGTDRNGKGGSEGKQENRGLDPLTFAVAFHWMDFAANGGDADAKTFLRENGELGKGL